MASSDKYNLNNLWQDLDQKRAEKLARLDKIVENSSEKNRNFFIVYLGLLVYVQAIIFSTTDLQLLVSTGGLKLPLIDLNVPLVGFYVVVPIFIIALHFNFLQNLESHHYKLMRWQELHPGGMVPRKYIYPFLFDYAILEHGSQFQPLVKFANSLLCYNLAYITLGLLLIRYSDRQDWLATLWHYLTFVFDSYLVMKFHRALKQNEVNELIVTNRNKSKKIFKLRLVDLRYLIGGSIGLLVLIEFLLTFFISYTSADFFVNKIQPWIQPMAFQNVDSIFGEKKYDIKPIEWLLPRIVINRNEKVWEPNINSIKFYAELSGISNLAKYFDENLKGFEPEIHSLRLIQLPTQELPHSVFSGVQMQGANLFMVNLKGASFNNVSLQGAFLDNAQMQEAILVGANLQGAELHETELLGAYLHGTQLQGAELHGTELQGAYLHGAKLQGAMIAGTFMEGADLNNAKLNGVIIDPDILQHAYNIPHASVYQINDQSYEKRLPINWEEIKKMATSIPNEKAKINFYARINMGINNASKIPQEQIVHNPKGIAEVALSQICLQDFNSKVSAQAFREQYLSFRKTNSDVLEQNQEFQDLIIDIDRKLCNLPECADIKDKIEGLDCKAILKNH